MSSGLSTSTGIVAHFEIFTVSKMEFALICIYFSISVQTFPTLPSLNIVIFLLFLRRISGVFDTFIGATLLITNSRLVSICDHYNQNHLVIIPKRVWGQHKPKKSGRAEGEGNFVILNPKANICFYWPCVVFYVWGRGGPVLLSFSEDVTMAGCWEHM